MDAQEANSVLATLDDIAIGAARRPARALSVGFKRELTEADLELILHPPGRGLEVAPMLRIKNTHHTAARLVAEGKRNIEISAITGYSPAWISSLQQDPSFKELIAYYQANKEAQFVDFHARLAALGLSTIEELQERMETHPEQFTPKELIMMGEMALDRSVTPGAKTQGANGQATPVAISVTFVTPQAKQQPGAGTIIDVEAG